MGVLGELFGRKIPDESGESGDGQPFVLGPIDLDRGIVVLHRAAAQPGDEPADGPAE